MLLLYYYLILYLTKYDKIHTIVKTGGILWEEILHGERGSLYVLNIFNRQAVLLRER